MLEVGIFEVGSSWVIYIKPWLLQRGICKNVRKRKIIKTIDIKKNKQKQKCINVCLSRKQMALGFNKQRTTSIYLFFYHYYFFAFYSSLKLDAYSKFWKTKDSKILAKTKQIKNSPKWSELTEWLFAQHPRTALKTGWSPRPWPSATTCSGAESPVSGCAADKAARRAHEFNWRRWN